VQSERNESDFDVRDQGYAVVDVVKWLNFFTFDVTGDLIYSEPFECLNERAYHPWIKLILDHLSGSSLLIAARFYTPLDKVIDWVLVTFFPKLAEEKETFTRQAFEKGIRRLERNSSKLLDITCLLQEQDPPMSTENILGNTTLVSIAGSETTATVLAAIFSYMSVANIDRLTTEIRSIGHGHGHESGLRLSELERLPYLTAVIFEGLRLGNPLPNGVPRVVPPQGAWICGQWVPGGVSHRRNLGLQ
jgi:cytochrome P450